MLWNIFGAPKSTAAAEKSVVPATVTRNGARNVSLGFEIDKKNSVAGFCNLNFPELFSRNKSIELRYSTNQDSKVSFRSVGAESTTEYSLFKNFLRTPRRVFEARGLLFRIQFPNSELDVKVEDLARVRMCKVKLGRKYRDATVSLQAGFIPRQGSFAKLEVSGTQTIDMYRGLYTKLEWGAGLITGNVHATDRFFRGSAVKGYKPASIYPSTEDGVGGGVSFVEAAQSIGVKLPHFDLFVFANMGFCSKQSNFVQTLTNCLQAMACDNKPRCLGLSIGAGISSLISLGNLGKRNIVASFSIPLTNNPDTQRFGIGLNAEF